MGVCLGTFHVANTTITFVEFEIEGVENGEGYGFTVAAAFVFYLFSHADICITRSAPSTGSS